MINTMHETTRDVGLHWSEAIRVLSSTCPEEAADVAVARTS
jgi:hypothetical protein